MTMNRREFLKTAAAGAALAPLAMQPRAQQPAPGAQAEKKPNILLLMVDQWRGDALGAAGNKIVKTPNIDQLAREGILFTCAYTSTPSCTPARAALLTGLSPWHHGQLGMGKMRETYRFEMPQALSDAGYYTFGIGKMHFHPQRSLHGFHGTLLDESGRRETPDFISDYHQWFAKVSEGKDPNALGIGWNDYAAGEYPYPEEWHPTHWTAQTAVEKIRDYKEDQPFFFKVSFARPHSPYDAPKRFQEMYHVEEMPKPFLGAWSWCYAEGPSPVPKDTWMDDLGVTQPLLSRRAYYGNITFIDEQIGRIIQTLKEKGVYENTLILFTADHGDMLGDHNLWRKTYAYEGSAHIPMIVRWPRAMGLEARRGTTLPHPVEIRDILPTFLDAAGATAPKFLDGASMLKLVRGEEKGWREYIDLEHAACYRGAPWWTALTDGKWKYIFFADTGAFFPKENSEQLFDLTRDPGELHDLAADPAHAATLERWRRRMAEHLAERGAPFVKDGKPMKRKSMLYSPFYKTGYPA